MELFVGSSVALAVLLLLLPNRFLPFPSRRLERQMIRLGRTPSRPDAGEGVRPIPLFQLAARLPLGPLVRVAETLYGERQRARFRQHVLHARLENRLSWNQFLQLKVAIPVAGFLYMGLVFLANGMDPALAIAALMPVLGFFVPDQWIAGRAKRRQRLVESQLPSCLTTLAITSEAGLGLAMAIEEVARTQRGALGSEFRWASEQISLGMPQGEALERMAARCGVPDLTIFVSALVQSYEKGASHVSATLRAQSQEAWSKRRQRAEELAQTASVRLFLPLLFLVFPAVLIFLLGPALITISEFFSSPVR